jgi:hypothetical protein
MDFNEIADYLSNDKIISTLIELWQDYKKITHNSFILLPGWWSLENIESIKNIIKLYELWINKEILKYQPYSSLNYGDSKIMYILEKTIQEDWTYDNNICEFLGYISCNIDKCEEKFVINITDEYTKNPSFDIVDRILKVNN